jgi:hypothetical protein
MQDWSLHSNSLLEHLGAEKEMPIVPIAKRLTTSEIGTCGRVVG